MPVALILLVEDDQELRAVVRRGLEEEGFAVSGAGTGAEAMERISAEAPDALVIDVGLPDADGRDLCQALRAQGIQSPGAVPDRARRARPIAWPASGRAVTTT